MFRHEIRSEITFEGTTDEAWGVLIDFLRYGEWNPGFVNFAGRPEVGQRLDITFTPRDGKRPMSMRPTVIEVEPGKRFRWLGHLLVPGLFDGEHRFEIHEAEPGRVTFVQGERFRGVLLPFLRGMLDRDTLPMFHRVNEAFARRVAELRERQSA